MTDLLNVLQLKRPAKHRQVNITGSFVVAFALGHKYGPEIRKIL